MFRLQNVKTNQKLLSKYNSKSHHYKRAQQRRLTICINLNTIPLNNQKLKTNIPSWYVLVHFLPDDVD